MSDKKNEKTVSYTEAMAEIEKILAELRGENIDVDTLAAKVERAAKLIDLCKKRLHDSEAEVKKLFGE
ncbi:MAG: exodeoxyribonuclease VII small subunit [Alistipes sp.]|nr:exodeoxyribonuclease VII small subunit [Alistipes sp.]